MRSAVIVSVVVLVSARALAQPAPERETAHADKMWGLGLSLGRGVIGHIGTCPSTCEPIAIETTGHFAWLAMPRLAVLVGYHGIFQATSNFSSSSAPPTTLDQRAVT